MNEINRRQLVQLGGAVGATLAMPNLSQAASASSPELRITTFRFDVTPPLGHSLCGGWIKPAEVIEDSLEAIGFVIVGADKPIVICSVDWTGLLNDAHIAWRTALAEAAGTTAQRVAVQCVHQHDAPFACLESQRIVKAAGGLPDIVDVDFFNRCLESARSAVGKAMQQTQPLTHIAVSQSTVDRVASNRRIIGLNGQVVSQRGSSSKDPTQHQFPEGLIDPLLKSVVFYNGSEKVVACHYYACHPMSHYGKGRVSSDFCGLARKRLQQAETGCTQLYFNGCGGNIGAGKYNDGSEEMRPILTDRIYSAMQRSLSTLEPQRIDSCNWSTQEILPPPREEHDLGQILKQIHDSSRKVVDRNRPAYTVAWHRRFEKQQPIVVSALNVNQATLLHLPAESFIEYQLRAQASAPKRFVACAAYGDGGPWYIPVKEAYSQGGYEPSVAWCNPSIDAMLCSAVTECIRVS